MGLPGAEAAAVAAFFEIAADFWENAPWEVLSREEVLEVRGLGPDPLYLSVHGGEEDEVQGLTVHPSPSEPAHAAVLFASRDGAGATLAAEVQAGGFRLAHPDALPLGYLPGQGHLAGPADLASLGRCLQVVTRFLEAGLDEREAVEEHPLSLPDRSRVRVTWREVDPFADLVRGRLAEAKAPSPGPPTEAGAEVPAARPFRHAPRPGRNDPCWCGSGQKYKKCHLEQDRQEESQALRADLGGD